VIESLETNKVLYAPGEKGTITLRIRNEHHAKEASGELTLRIESGIRKSRDLAKETVQLEAKASKELTFPFTASGRWGKTVRAILSQKKGTAEKVNYFSVSDMLWDVGIGFATPIKTLDPGELGRSMRMVTKMRGDYCNWIDLFFWAPCDWSKQSKTGLDQWWGGQEMYAHSEKGLTQFIAACKAEGIRVSSYANGNPSGPYAFEVARQHPEWFGGPANIKAGAELLDRWNAPDWDGRSEAMSKLSWNVIKPDFHQLAAVDYGIDQLIQGAKDWGFDAIRFDGHYAVGSVPVSTRNMRHLKERVTKEKPGLKLGFNWGRAPEWRLGYTHELREAMAGGNLYMQEGIRHLQYTGARYTSWKHYMSNELRVAKRIQGLGGFYHCIWLLNLHNNDAKAYYILVYGLIAGGHPAYGSQNAAPGCENWGAFITRWSELLWDRRITKVEDPKRIAAVELIPEDEGKKVDRQTDAELDALIDEDLGDDDGLPTVTLEKKKPKKDNTGRLHWENMVQERILSATKKQVILHLVRAPRSDVIGKVKLPDPEHGTIEVRFKAIKGLSDKVLVLRPEQKGFSATETLKAGTLRIPKPGNWTVVVAEVEGDFTVPAEPPRFTEQPKITTGAKVQNVSNDPNQSADDEESATKFVYRGLDYDRLLNSGSTNIGTCTVEDPDSPLGTVQGRKINKRGERMGMWYVGTPHPARYRMSIRIKWTDAKETPTPQILKMVWKNHQLGGMKKPGIRKIFVTPGYPDAPEGAITLKEKGKYHNYVVGEMDMWNPGGNFHYTATTKTEKPGDNQIFVERLMFKTLKPYGDLDIVKVKPEWYRAKRPAGLRTPNAANPEKLLFVKGLYWQQYLTGIKTAVDQTYRAPKYDGLYPYDTVVLANIKKVKRQVYRDYIEDGGRVVILGGTDSFNGLMIRRSYLSDTLPVDFADEATIVAASKPLPLRVKGAKVGAEGGLVLWYTPATPREGSTVLATAGDIPIAVEKKYGKGTVVVFLGTTLGTDSKDGKPFWRTPAWPALFERMVRGK
jgi:hypothetical protein